MITFSLLQTVVLLMSAFVCLWFTTQAMRQTGKILPFVPFISFTVGLCGIATLINYGEFFSFWKLVASAFYVLGDMLLLFVVVWFIYKQYE